MLFSQVDVFSFIVVDVLNCISKLVKDECDVSVDAAFVSAGN